MVLTWSYVDPIAPELPVLMSFYRDTPPRSDEVMNIKGTKFSK